MRSGMLTKCLFLVALFGLYPSSSTSPQYSIEAIRYGSVSGYGTANLVMGARKDEKVDIAMVIWLIRGGGHTVLFDTGFHREQWFKSLPVTDYIRPDEAVKLAGVRREDVTDIIISHAHFDHVGGIDLFPRATLWIQ